MIRHKVFISYHHTDKDEAYKLEFERKTQNIIISQAVQFGDYSNDLSDNNIAKRKMLKAIYTGIFKTSKSYFILKFN